jgi:hypothetical protein
LDRIPQGSLLKAFRAFIGGIKKVPFVRYAWWRLVERPLYSWPGPDRPPIICHDDEQGWYLDK